MSMNKSTISKQRSYLTDLYSTNAYKSRKLSMLWLMLLTLLLLPTRMVAQTDYAYAEFDEGTGTLTFKWSNSTSIPTGAYDLNEGHNKPEWYDKREKIKTVVFDASFACARPTSCYYWFSGCKNLTDIEGIENLNTENVTNMNSMFDRCSALTSLDLTNFNTAKVSDMSYMFMGCSALTTIFVSDKFVTDQVTSSDNMFHMCINLIGAIEYDGSKSDHTYANYETGYFSPEGGFPGYAVFDEGTGTLTFKWSNSTSIPTGAYDLNEGHNKPEWYDKREKIKTVVFDASFACARPTSCFYWFYGCKNLVNIKGIENLNTEKVTMMYSMFEKCSALTSLDLTNFNTANVTDMSNMFYDCSTLTTIYASDKFVTIQVTYDWGMFYSCNKLIGAIEYDGTNNSKNYANYNDGYFTPKGGFHAYAEFDEGTGTLTFRRGASKPEGAYDLYAGIYYPGWYYTQKEKIKTVVFDASFACARPTSCYYWFSGCNNLTEIKGIENLNTENVTNMSYMFVKCKALTSLNLTSFNTEKVTNMQGMFKECSDLTSLDLSNFNTEKVTDMQGMFWECSNLTSLNLTRLNTENVTAMNGMFYGCTKLESLDLSNFNTAKVTKMNQMFYNCNKLTSLDLTSFNTAEVTKMDNMFRSCTDLTSLDLSNFNTAKVTDMNYMFYNCNELKSLDITSFNTAEVTKMDNMFESCFALTSLDLSSFNTAEVTNMSYMFKSCKALTSLDLTSFNTAKVENMTEMFNNCPALTTIYASDKFVTGQVTNSRNMFYGCTELKGFIDKYDESKIDHTYANYKTGYFTKLVVRNGDERYGITGETTQLTVDNLALTDNKDLVVYEPFTATAASYSRTINTTWATLCLPFDVSLDDQNFRAFELGSVNNDEVVLKELNTIIPAGTPVIIKMTNGATELSFNVANKEIAKDVKTSATDDNNYQLQGLYTQKVFSKDTDNNCYIVKGDKLMNPAKLLLYTNVTKVASKPFRAYMVDNSSAPSAGAKMFSIGFDDDSTTAIDSLNTIANDKAEYYDLQGKRLNEPQKGINIVKRGNKTMKVIIK